MFLVLQLGYQDTLLEKKYASSVATLRESLMDRPEDLSFENEVRHKLLIDHSEDGSLILNLFKSGLLDRAETKVFSSSHLRKDIVRKVSSVTPPGNVYYSGFYPVGGEGEASPQLPSFPPKLPSFPPKLPSFPPKPSSFPPNVACCEPYIALNCVSGDLKFKIFWGEPQTPLI